MIYAIATIIVVLIGGAIYFASFFRKAGSATVAAAVAEKTVKVQQAQAQAQADAPQGKPEIVKRLREKGL